MKESNRSRRFFISKHTIGMCGVGKFMKIWKEWDVAACPQCGNFEYASHAWLCKETGAEEMRGSALDKVKEWIESVNTKSRYSSYYLSLFTKLEKWPYTQLPPSHIHTRTHTRYHWSTARYKVAIPFYRLDHSRMGMQYVGSAHWGPPSSRKDCGCQATTNTCLWYNKSIPQPPDFPTIPQSPYLTRPTHHQLLRQVEPHKTAWLLQAKA